MVRHGGSSAGSYLTDPTSPIPSHCASIVVTSTVRVNNYKEQTFSNKAMSHVNVVQLSARKINCLQQLLVHLRIFGNNFRYKHVGSEYRSQFFLHLFTDYMYIMKNSLHLSVETAITLYQNTSIPVLYMHTDIGTT